MCNMYVFKVYKMVCLLAFAYGRHMWWKSTKLEKAFWKYARKNVKVFSDDAVGDGISVAQCIPYLLFAYLLPYFIHTNTLMYSRVLVWCCSWVLMFSSLLAWLWLRKFKSILHRSFFHLISSSDHSTHAYITLFTV